MLKQIDPGLRRDSKLGQKRFTLQSTLRTKGVGMLELERGPRRHMHDSIYDLVPKPLDERFLKFDDMPKIASKYKRDNKTTDMLT